jgi:hypothetical protein
MILESDSFLLLGKHLPGWLFIRYFIMKSSISFSEKIKDKIFQDKFPQSRYYLSVKASPTAMATDYSFNFSHLQGGGTLSGRRSFLFRLTRNMIFRKLKFLFRQLWKNVHSQVN